MTVSLKNSNVLLSVTQEISTTEAVALGSRYHGLKTKSVSLVETSTDLLPLDRLHSTEARILRLNAFI